uniref:NADH dehydrogenase subunit 5 n=1 Tax=Sorineuchora formosana TaxID=3037028 RepID=UPI0027A3100B|nr:NADH dehydrogenase subunit 5 [Sorineuchora formosana]WGO57646.1 NADH dehydrogenase subunit 5 [Sorineuchora formosana]
MSICYVWFIFLMIVSIFMHLFGIYFILNNFIVFVEWKLISLNSVDIVMSLLFDWMSLTFMGFVLFISSLVILYSGFYMYGDLTICRFIFLVLLFVLSMMFLIVSPNMVSILLGWDGLGLVSYCLVIYYQNVKSYNAGMLTALSNRVGDVFLLMIISWMLCFGSWNYIYYLDYYTNSFEMKIISFFVLFAAMTSSAQIPFSSWLPVAMAAPTPVSALVHSSTLVTAGVYLLIRFSPLFDGDLNFFMFLISGLTMFMAGLGANFEYDLSKIIALSTLSQLGLMMSTLAIGYSELAFFHLLMHALFKALLFMCAGVYIHSMSDSQDIRFMGGLSFQMPFTSSCLMISNFALCGIPFLAGFYSSDLILEMVSMSYINLFGYFLFFFSTGLTVCYSLRLFYYVMCGDFNLNCFHSVFEYEYSMMYSMLFLLFFVIFGGSIFSWIFFMNPYLVILPLYLSLFVIFVSINGGILGYEMSKMYSGNKLFSLKFMFEVGFLGSMWFMPYIFTYGISRYFLIFGYNSLSIIDLGWSEYFGGQNLFIVFFIVSKFNQVWQYSSLSLFMFFFIIWFIFIFSIFML